MPVLIRGQAIDMLNLIGKPTEVEGLMSVGGMLLTDMPQEILVAGQVFSLDEVTLADDGNYIGTYYRDMPIQPRNIRKGFENV